MLEISSTMGEEKLSDFSLDLPIHHLASSIFVPDRFVYSPLCFSIIRFILSPSPFFLIALRIRRSDDNVSEIFLVSTLKYISLICTKRSCTIFLDMMFERVGYGARIEQDVYGQPSRIEQL